MMRVNKTFVTFLLLTMSLLLAAVVIAETAVPAPQIEYLWVQDGEIEDRGLVHRSNPWTEFYTSAPAALAGTTETGTRAITYTHALEGTLKIPQADLEAQLGFRLDAKETGSTTRTSRALEKGETVVMEYRETWRCYKVSQKEVKHTYGWTYIDGQAVYVDEYVDTGATQVAVVYKALLPQVRVTYMPR